MVVTVCEHLDDVAGELEVAHGQIVFSLDPADAGRTHLGYAVVRVAAPVGRHEGVALVVGDAAIVGVPDPIRILVRDERGTDPPASLVVRRRALPILLSVDRIASRAWILRRLVRGAAWFAAQGEADDVPIACPEDGPPGTADALDPASLQGEE